MSDQGSRAATGEEEFIRVVDTSGPRTPGERLRGVAPTGGLCEAGG